MDWKLHVDEVNVSITPVAGAKLYVRALNLTVGLNYIPCATIEALPIENNSGGATVTASTAKLDEVSSLYKTLLDKAVSLDTTATITAELTLNCPGGSKTEKIELKDWILVEAELDSIAPGKAPALRVSFQHPIVMLAKTGFVYQNLESEDMRFFHSVGGKDVIEVMDEVYKGVASEKLKYKKIESLAKGGTEDKFQKKIEQFRKDLGEYYPGKYIDCNTGGLFLENTLPTSAVRYVTAKLVFPSAADNKSTWRRLIEDVCGIMQTFIVPLYDKEKLSLEPDSPWQEPVYKVSSEYITSLDMSPIDKSPIIGVESAKLTFDKREMSYDLNTRIVVDGLSVRQAMYIPEEALDDTKGDILQSRESRFIREVLMSDMGKSLTYDAGTNPQDTKNGIQPKDHAQASGNVAQGVFIAAYRSSCISTVITIPRFKDDDDKIIYPGRVLSVLDSETSKIVFEGLVSVLDVRISEDGGCYTNISLTHTRPKGGAKLVKDGTENDCYSKPNRPL